MKTIKTRLALGFIGAMVALMGVGFSRVGFADDSLPILHPLSGILQNLIPQSPSPTPQRPASTTQNSKNLSTEHYLALYNAAVENFNDVVDSGNDDATFNALEQIYLVVLSIESLKDDAYQQLTQLKQSIIDTGGGTTEQLREAEASRKRALEWGEAFDSANGEYNEKLDEYLKEESKDADEAADPAVPPSSAPPSHSNSDDDDDDDDSDVAAPEDAGEDSGTPNPEGDVRVTHMKGSRSLFVHPRSKLTNPNPEGDTSSSTHRNPFKGSAPAINPQGGFTDPSPEGGSKLRRLTGPAPVINLRAPLINPDPEGSTSPSTGIHPLLKGTAPKIINPRAPKANLNKNLNRTRIESTGLNR